MVNYFTYEYGHSILNIMKIFNIFSLTVFALIIIFSLKKQTTVKTQNRNVIIYVCLVAVVLVAAVLRLYRLDSIPIDIAPDEASVYFDALCLANYGTNRWGEINSVYFNTWEFAGQSPAMATLASVFIRIFGNSLFVFRLSQAIPAIITVLLAFFICKRLFNPLTGLIAAAILAISPWHIMMSRWALDCNLSAFAVTAAICTLVYSLDDSGNMNKVFYLFCIFTGLSLYTYATTCIMMFAFVVLVYLYMLIKKRIDFKIFIPANILLFIIALPMIYFFAVHYLGLPAFESSFLTIPYLKGFRSDDISANLIANIINHISNIYQPYERVVYYPQFSVMYVFSIPLLIYGIRLSVKKFNRSFVLLFWILGSLIQLGIVSNSGYWAIVNLAAALPYFIAIAINELFHKNNLSKIVIPMMYAVGTVAFLYTYFAVLPEETGIKIGAGTKDAILYAQNMGVEKIYFSEYSGVGDAFIYHALNNQDSPEEFMSKIVRDPDGEHGKEIVKYDNLIFHQDIYQRTHENDAAFVLYNYLDHVSYFQDLGYSIKTFRNFSVAYKE